MANDVNRACKLYNDKILSKSIFSLVSEYYMHLHSLFHFFLLSITRSVWPASFLFHVIQW